MNHIFREYDIRGIFEKELTENTIKKIGFFFGEEIKKIGNSVGVGYDARLHSPLILKWLISGLNHSGLKVFNMGLVPTPCTYFSSFTQGMDGSVMITGSHNPKVYNGLKMTINKQPFFGENITKLYEKIISSNIDIPDNFQFTQIDTLDKYINFLVSQFSHLKNMKEKIIIDCANGTAGVVLPEICKALSLNARIIFQEPDGNFPNHHPDPSVEENLKDIKNYLKNENYDLGFAFDGDSDRIAVLTKKHNIKGDILALLYSKPLKNPRIMGEVKCSSIMFDEVNKTGKAFMCKTGHSNIKVKMKELNIDVAAEVSGHIFFAHRYFGYDDAIYAMLRALELVKDGMNLDKELENLPKMFSTDEIKIKTTEKEKFILVEKLKKYLQNPDIDFPKILKIIEIDGVRVVFENGWGLIRASNTTPILVARFEANTEENMLLYQNSLEDALKMVMNKK